MKKFKPDWDMREAALESIREHQQMVKDLQQQLAAKDAEITALKKGSAVSSEMLDGIGQELIQELRAEIAALKEQLKDEALAFNHANDIVGKQEEEIAALWAENERLDRYGKQEYRIELLLREDLEKQFNEIKSLREQLARASESIQEKGSSNG